LDAKLLVDRKEDMLIEFL
jgi:hypothetical protein